MFKSLLSLFAAAALFLGATTALAQTPWPPGATAVYYNSSYNCDAAGTSCGTYVARALYTGGGQMGNCCIGQNYGSQWFGGNTITNNVFNAGNGYFHDGLGGPGLVSANGLFMAQIVDGNLSVFYTGGVLGTTTAPYPTYKRLWSSNTPNGGPNQNSGTYGVVQNGKFELITQQSNPIANNVLLWSVGGGNAAKLVLQNSGDLQLLDASGNILWHTNTASDLVMYSWDLSRGDSLISLNGRFRTTMQADGNLVVTNLVTGAQIWQTGTNTNPASTLARMQSNGSLAVHHWNGTTWSVVWTSNTATAPVGGLARMEIGGHLRVWHWNGSTWSVVWSKP